MARVAEARVCQSDFSVTLGRPGATCALRHPSALAHRRPGPPNQPGHFPVAQAAVLSLSRA